MNQHYSGAPVCAPSRASFLTGLTQGHANVQDGQFDKGLGDSLTVVSVLKQGGYATAAFGKWGWQGGDWNNKENKNPPPDLSESAKVADYSTWASIPKKRGFNYFIGYVRRVDGQYHYAKGDERQVWANDREVSAELDKWYTADLWTAQAKKRIVQETASNPTKSFFVFRAYDTPHAKLENPPAPYPKVGGLQGGVQWTGRLHAMINTATGTVDGFMYPDFANATWDDDHNPATPEVPWPDVQKRYANDVRRIDDGVGDVLQLLKDLKIDDNTLVVFTSDNGPSIESYLPEGYAPTFLRGYGPCDGIKSETWEGSMREPTIARWPAAIPYGRADDLASGQWDLLCTFADLAGVAAPAASDGVSLMLALTGKGNPQPSQLYIEYFHNARPPDFADFAPSHRGRKRGQMQAIYLNG